MVRQTRETDATKPDAETQKYKQRKKQRCRQMHWGTRAAICTGEAEWKHIETVGHVQQFEIMWKVVTTQWFWITDLYWPIVESEHLLKINFQKQNCHKLPRGLIGGQNLKLVSDLIGWIDTKNFLMRKMKEWTRLGDYISFPCHGQELMTKNDDVISRHNGKI